MPKSPNKADILFGKAKADEILLDVIIDLPIVLDEIFGFHSQQEIAFQKNFQPRLF